MDCFATLAMTTENAKFRREGHLAPEPFYGHHVFKTGALPQPFESRSMSTLQLDPPIPVITPKGDGYAHLLIDYGPEYNLLWVCFLDDSGECWTYDNTQIRAQKNITMGRTFVSRHQTKAPSVAAE
jgi:hypothetical protein